MIAQKEMTCLDKDENIAKYFEVDDEPELINFNHEKYLFPRPSHHLMTKLRPGVARPLSPTLKVYSPGKVIPGAAILCEGFDNMREWKDTIRFAGFLMKRGHTNGMSMFNSRHHWDMRTKFLNARLQCMDKIREEPRGVQKPFIGFLVPLPAAVQQAMREERNKMTPHERDRCARKELNNANRDVETQNYLQKDRDNIEAVEESYSYQKRNGNTNTNKNVDSQHTNAALPLTESLVMLREHYPLKKEMVEKVKQNTRDEKVQHESLQNVLNNEARYEIQWIPATYPENNAAATSSKDVIFRKVSSSEKPKRGLSSKSKTWPRNVEKLVLENIDNDVSELKVVTSERCEQFVEQDTVEQSKQNRTVLRFEQLRKRLRNLFSSFRRNKVTPVNFY